MALASRSNRIFSFASFANSDGRILTATVRPRRVSRAEYTSPIPPAPSGAMISYGPRRAPGASFTERLRIHRGRVLPERRQNGRLCPVGSCEQLDHLSAGIDDVEIPAGNDVDRQSDFLR